MNWFHKLLTILGDLIGVASIFALLYIGLVAIEILQ